MPKDKSTGKKLADMLYGNPERAAFGVFPQMKPKRSKQDPEAAKNFPVDLARGVVAGALGIPGDIESLARLPYELYTGNDSPTILPTSEDVLKRIPFGSDTPASQFAAGLGTLAGGSANLGAIPRAVKAAPGALKAAARNISAPRTLNPQAGVFIGPKAKTFNKSRAEMAVAMEEARRSPEEIWLATGTFRGPDGILRQEIDDRAAKLVLPDEQQDRVAALKGRVGEMKESIKPTPQKDLFPKALTEAKKGVRSNIDALKEEISGRSKNARTQGLDAQYAFDHPELYEAYPELRDLNIVMGGREGTAQGASGALSVQQKTDSFPGRMEMDMYNRGLMSKNPTSVALHEMQHAIQTLEGMGPGGSPTVAFQNPEAFEILKQIRKEAYKPASLQEFQKANKYPDSEAQERYVEYLDQLRSGANANPVIERALQERAAMEYYKRLAGEAEARAVQERQMMTPSQRMQTPPPASYDVPQEDLIVKPPREYADGGSVHISDNPDVMQLELAKGGAIRMQAGGVPGLVGRGIKAVAKAFKPEKEAAVPLTLPRVRPTTQDIMEAAERVGKQQAGEFVKSPLLKKTTNLAGRSKKEVDRLKELEYKLTPIKDLPEMKPYEAKVGEVNIALPGDQTVSDMLLESVDGVPIGTTSEGGALFGRGRLADPEDKRAFWASNIGPAGAFQRKVTELAKLYETDMVTAYHLAMGQTANNFAQHIADANMRAIDFSKLDKKKMNLFDSEIANGFYKKDNKTGEVVWTQFPEWPGIANPDEALAAMKDNPELRKWFNDRMKTEGVTKKSDLPYGKSIEWAMTEPELRDMEINLTGLSAGRMKPGAELIPDSAHQTYSHDIPGTALGRAPELSPFSISFPDATAFVREKYRPQDFTGTIQKVFPHQVVDEAYLEDMYKYYTQLRKVRGFKKGGAVHKAAGGEITADDLILEERKL